VITGHKKATIAEKTIVVAVIRALLIVTCGF
jgi:hypothetical protein